MRAKCTCLRSRQQRKSCLDSIRTVRMRHIHCAVVLQSLWGLLSSDMDLRVCGSMHGKNLDCFY